MPNLTKVISLILLFISINLSSQEFTTIWTTTNSSSGSSGNSEVSIPTNPAYTTYNYNVDWGDGTSDANVTGNILHTYATSGTYTIKISGSFPAIYFNDTGDRNKIIEILDWGNIQWQSMENAFFGCENLNFDAIAAPDLSQVSSLKNMFRECYSFNGIVNSWDVSNVTDISGMFASCSVFNRPLDNWTTNLVTDMSETFKNCSSFNEPLDNWNTSAVSSMKDMFYSCVNFNQNISNWNVSQVTDMAGMFVACRKFNQPLGNWDVSQVTDMNLMFFRTNDFNQDLSSWQVGNVTDMTRMFHESAISYPMNDWDVAKVTSMQQMFADTPNFNQPLSNWDVSNVTNMAQMFRNARLFDQPLNDWDVSAVTTMQSMFAGTSSPTSTSFNQPLNNWDVNNVTDMSSMFYNSTTFNQNINNWNVSSVTNMSQMFRNADAFNQPLNNWDVSNVSNMQYMFQQNDGFDQPLNDWTTSSLTNISFIFSGNSIYNHPLNNWDVSKVTNMGSAFNNASAFNQNLGVWDISSVTNLGNMLSNSGISQENYDAILTAWSNQTVRTGLTLGATNLQYCDALPQRQSLIDVDGWNILGDAVNCSYVLCTDITMPHASDTATPANSDIRWDPAPNADGYRVTIEVERGGTRSYVSINGNPANNYDIGNVVGVSFTNEFLAGDTVFVTVVPYNSEGPATGCQEISFTVVESWVNNPNAFKFTIDTRNLDTQSTATNQYRLQLLSSLDYDFNIDWGDGQYNNNVSSDITHTYLAPGIYTISIIGDFPSFYHASSNRDNLKLISMDQWGSQVWESMRQTFYFCENMEYNATDIPNLSMVTDMRSMFRRATLFNTNINNWDVSNVSDMSAMFYQAYIYNQPMDTWNVSNVTRMDNMFDTANEFNQNINGWDVSNVTSMYNMFSNTDNYNQPLNNWNVSSVTSMRQMFQRADVFNQPLDNWDVTSVTNMHEMFYDAELFNQNIDNWDVGNVTLTSGMFYSAKAFNQPLNSWDVSKVTNMSSMFYGASVFDQPLNNWTVDNVTNMSSMFSSATSFNQNIESWNVTNVISMSYMFNYATSYNQALNNWDVNSVVNMSGMFRGTQSFNQPLNNWDVSAVANMSAMFEDAIIFNQPLDNWNVSSVTLMESMFEDAEAYNQPMNNWNVFVVTNFESMFQNAAVFNQPLNNWNTEKAKNMASMFYGANAFDQDIDSWNVTYVTTMANMFREAYAFNRSLNSWNVASVNTMSSMFQNATSFNENIAGWNVRGVTTMQNMFNGASSFNQNLNNWRVSGVGNMDYMFRDATAYNQAMDLWNLGDVSMRSAFYNATTFNQYLGDWDISGVNNMNDMLDNTALTRENYDNTLIAWSDQTLTNGIMLGAQGLPYCDAQEERLSIMTNFGWTFDLDVRDCPIPECTLLASPLNGDTDVPVNTNITWEPTLFAQGYRLTVGTSAGGNDIVDNETIINETSYEFATNFNTGDIIFVTLIPFNDEGEAVGPCTEESFTISNDPATIPECTSMTAPLNGANDISVGTDLSWNPISNADGYLLNVGTSSGATDILNGLDVGNTIHYEFTTDLPEDSDIYVTITPYNDEGNATCTEEVFHTEIIPVPPTCTNLTLPLNGAVDVAKDTHLTWNAINNATGYLVKVGTTAGGNEVVNNIDVGNVTTYDIPVDLQEGRLHYVTITPYNLEGDAANCTEETFTTGDSSIPPSCTMLTSPSNNATGVDPSTNLTWVEQTSATGYLLTVGTSSGGSDIFSGDVGNVITYDLATDLPENTTIFVTITPYNDNGNPTCSEERFTTNGPPQCTSLSSPANLAVNVPVDTGIEWNATAGAVGYKLTVNASITTANNVMGLDISSGTTYNFPNNFEQGETVTVTIVPYNSFGDAVGPCTPESFTIVPPPRPNCTTLTEPLSNAVDVNTDTNIEWAPVLGAEGYKLTVTASNSTANNLTDTNVTTGNSYNFLNDFEQGETVTVTVIPYNTSGDAIGCNSESFTIKPVPSCTTLSAPLNEATNVDLDTSISWNAVSDAIGYFVSVTASASTANNITELKTTDTSYTFNSSFDQGETVSVHIVPYNESGNAIGCTTERFTIESVPVCTNLISPVNGAIDLPVDPTLEWMPIDTAVGYRLSVTASSSTVNNVIDLDITSGNTYTVPNEFEQGETVTVSITPYNDAGEAINCPAESFTIKPIPNCTNLNSPENGQVLAQVNEISWNSDPYANGYRLTVTADSSTINNVDNLDITDTSYTFPQNFNEGETVTVTIVPYNELGNAAGCSPESFTIRPLPVCTDLIAPLQDGINIPVTTDIEWNNVLDADGYRISVGTTPNGTDIVENEDVASLTSYTFAENLPSETMIYVSIIPYNTSGDAQNCSYDSFETGRIAPDCATIVSPANGERDVPLESVITWNEVEKTDGYRISIGTSPQNNDLADNLDMGTETSYTHPEEFPFGTEIHVTITAYNTVGDAMDCDQFTFTTLVPEDDTKYGFSPNGDGINDYWHIEHIEYYPQNVVTIYNRWGDMVFQIENYDNASHIFSGTANMKTKMGADILPSGTYFFNIQIEGETILNKTQGFLVLKR
ncbi:gliding motility-associated C-terminal domain-containing protein [Maribacter sedimenticola]|uniref:Gliding motility-associated C-terminal domain-containing protein n=1 Tax=Maribacter sedimenticola TaxID=228956 RepID=A0ABY1SHR9_9FLAO|nr:BspA family leucine-rich repeat surface protein [Maribacter sedimenticola]SNR55111.1 gliding motility-associated C-terminal domain-containing protein [Maribacter sedimenticola]